MLKPQGPAWLPAPEERDHRAAKSYLSLIFDGTTTDRHIKQRRAAEVSSFKAKDIFRASRLPLLGVSNMHMEKDSAKIESGKELPPLLLIRDSANSSFIVADGYHRLCAVYSYDEDALIPCKIV